jgi:hypothetical protein
MLYLNQLLRQADHIHGLLFQSENNYDEYALLDKEKIDKKCIYVIIAKENVQGHEENKNYDYI